LLGRVAFWPARPAAVRAAADRPAARRGAWWKVADVVVRRHTAVWTVTAAVLVIASAFAPQLDADGVPRSDLFLTELEPARGQEEGRRWGGAPAHGGVDGDRARAGDRRRLVPATRRRRGAALGLLPHRGRLGARPGGAVRALSRRCRRPGGDLRRPGRGRAGP